MATTKIEVEAVVAGLDLNVKLGDTLYIHDGVVIGARSIHDTPKSTAEVLRALEVWPTIEEIEGANTPKQDKTAAAEPSPEQLWAEIRQAGADVAKAMSEGMSEAMRLEDELQRLRAPTSRLDKAAFAASRAAGGKAAAAKLTPEQRTERSRQAALARWSKGRPWKAPKGA